jgi:4-amino-4-deoxy-L-arabinose transferase-like glycosyltransferase
VLAFALRVRGMRDGFYGDEYYSLAEVGGRSFAGMLDAVANGAGQGSPLENTPPLYFVLAWLSARAGDPTTWLRLPSVVLSTATVPVVFALGLRTVGRPAALVGAGFVALSPFAIFYGVEARAYATLMFFGALSTLVLTRAVEADGHRWWVGYGLSVAALLYSHYTGIILVAVQVGWALSFHRPRWRPLVLALAGAAVAYAGWLPYVHSEPADYGVLATLGGFGYADATLQWLVGFPELSPEDFPGTLSLVLMGSGLVLGLLGAVLAVVHRREDGTPGPRLSSTRVLVLALALVTPVFCLLYGAVVGNELFRFPRNLSASFPFVGLVLGLALTPPHRLARLAVAVAGFGLGLAALRTLDDSFHRPDFPGVARLLDERARPLEPIIYFGAGFTPFELGDALRAYYERPHALRGADTQQGSVASSVQAPGGGRRRFVVVQ